MEIVSSILPLVTNLATRNRDYVVFAGAGLSKDAGVKSGWDILIESLRPLYITDTKIEEVKEITPTEIVSWYLANENIKNLGYSEILEKMYPGNIERREYLKQFFADVKPGEAHRELAKLVAMGLVRYIFTTNFDDLLEKALDEFNVNYDVMFSDDVLSETKSWDRVKECRIYKLHGDYRVGKIRNTIRELEFLDPLISQDFQYIIDRHGVIVIGYSGRDCAIMEHFCNRRPFAYPMYWQYLELPQQTEEYKYFYELKDKYEQVHKRPIEFIQNKSASSFLRQISTGIEKLNMLLIIGQNNFDGFDSIVVNSDSKKLRSFSYEILNSLCNKFDEYKLKEESDRFFKYKFEIFVKLINETKPFLKYLDTLLKYDQDKEFLFIIKKYMFYILDLIKTRYSEEFIKHSYPYFILLTSGSLLVRYDKVFLSEIFPKMEIRISSDESFSFMSRASLHGDGWDYIKQEIYKSNYYAAKYTIIRDHLLPDFLTNKELDLFDSYLTLKTFIHNLGFKWFNGSAIYDNGILTEAFRRYLEEDIKTEDQAKDFLIYIRKELQYISNRGSDFSISILTEYIHSKYKV